jgi:hypothetical protein
MNRCFLVTLALLCCGRGVAGDRSSRPGEVQFFETRIRPLLARRCFSCHGPDKQRSDLRLDSGDAVRRGGASGEPAVVPGRPDQGRLIRAVHRRDGTPPMPPDGRLTDRELADLARWVQTGAPYPDRAEPAPAAGRHWAFDPPGDPPVPEVRDRSWPRTPIDRFILAELEAQGLRPAAPADRRTLIRRAAFDLTGLPPTPKEVEEFVNDPSPDAYDKVIDRLLASPAYGERWGRHWLDVARYADSNGLDENVAHGNAWRYRDYVVAAFNADKPYDQFLAEQVAGDLLPSNDPAVRRQRLIATAFLALGPKVLAEPDEKKMELDIVDEQVDTLGRAALGLTLGCARCHDHKFDPISQEDYYALAGIFVSTRTMETFKKVARWHEHVLATPEQLACKEEHDRRVAGLKARIKELGQQGKDPKPDGERAAQLQKCRDELAALEKSAPELPSAMGVAEAAVTDVPVLHRGNPLTPGRVVARRFPVVLAGADQPPLPPGQSGRLELAGWLTRPDHPLTSRVLVNRLWRWHFGQGIVRSVDNFGRLSERPTHPHLLDWLARRFVAGGWSVKALHRLILLSATYRMSAGHDPRAAEIDPDNRLWWRTNRRRLEAEAIRDALLAIAGTLDRTAGGPALKHVPNRGYLFDHTSKDQTTYDSRRRSLYLPVIRNHLYDVFQLFDATDAAVSSGDRATTTVATQALFMLNSDLMIEASERLATRLLARADLDDAGRVRLLYRTAYGRPPTPREADRAIGAIAGFAAALRDTEPDAARRQARAWALFVHAVLAANEFVNVD